MREQQPNRLPSEPGARRRAFALSIIIALAAGASGCSTQITDDVVRRVGVSDVAKRADERRTRALLIDARPEAAYREGRLPGAVNMSLADVAAERRDPALERYKTLVVYGQNPGSGAALALAKRLIALRYSDVQYFEGGVDAWRAAGLALER